MPKQPNRKFRGASALEGFATMTVALIFCSPHHRSQPALRLN
jgi:hypothetical protein